MKIYEDKIYSLGETVTGQTQTMSQAVQKTLVIIPGLFEPPVRTLRATIPENESHIFR